MVCDLADRAVQLAGRPRASSPSCAVTACPALTGVDTRRLTRHVREAGAVPCAFGTAPEAELRAAAAAAAGTDGLDLVSGVTTTEPSVHPGTAAGATSGLRIVAYDFGVKTTMVRPARPRWAPSPWCRPARRPTRCSRSSPTASSSPTARATRPPCPGPTAAVADLVGRVPVFGICLGHQILATALGGTTYKLPFGHHGANHPVQRLETGVVEITSQNHNYAVAAGSVPDAETTHVNLNDGVIEGFRSLTAPAFSVQYHPEAAPGPARRPLSLRRVPRPDARPSRPRRDALSGPGRRTPTCRAATTCSRSSSSGPARS